MLEFDEGSVAGDLRNFAVDHVPDLVNALDLHPGIGSQLFHSQGDALVLRIRIKDDGIHVVVLFNYFAGMGDLAGPGHIRNVYHAVNAFLQFHKSSVTGEVADFSADAGAHRIVVPHHVPWIRIQMTHTERNFLFVFLYPQHYGVDLLADPEHFVGAVNLSDPGELGHMNESFHALFEFHKGAIGYQIDDLAPHLGTHRITCFNTFPTD